MKKATQSLSIVSAQSISLALPICNRNTPAERANYYHELSLKSGMVSIMAGLAVGYELSSVRSSLGWGRYIGWIEENCSFKREQARRYVEMYERALKPALEIAAGELEGEKADVRRPTANDYRAAAEKLDAHTVSEAFKALGIVKKSDNHGGRRDGAGRKRKCEDVAEALDEISTMETLLWTEIKGALDLIVKRDAEKDVFRRLSEEHLDEVSKTLSDLADKASQAFAARLQSIEISAREVSL